MTEELKVNLEGKIYFLRKFDNAIGFSPNEVKVSITLEDSTRIEFNLLQQPELKAAVWKAISDMIHDTFHEIEKLKSPNR